MPQKYRVIRAHQPDSTNPLIVSKGDRLRCERRQTIWEGWLWCWKPDGPGGWVPEAWVEVEGDTCRMKRGYNAAELLVEPGDYLRPILTQSGWLLAVTRAGVTGWVPLGNVESDEDFTE